MSTSPSTRTVLQLARAVAPAVDGCCGWLPHPVPAVLVDLSAAIRPGLPHRGRFDGPQSLPRRERLER